MLGVEDQRDVHHLDVQIARLLVVQQSEEMAAQGLFVAGAVDANTVVGEAIPVAHDRRESGHQPLGHVALLVEAELRLQRAKYGRTGTHDIHRMSASRDAFQHFLQCLRQVTHGLQATLVIGQLLGVRQLTVEQQVGHFLEIALGCQVAHVVTTIGQPGTGLAHGTQGGLSGDLSAQARAAQNFCFSHCYLLLGFVLDTANHVEKWIAKAPLANPMGPSGQLFF